MDGGQQSLIQRCWTDPPSGRPGIEDIRETVQDLMQQCAKFENCVALVK